MKKWLNSGSPMIWLNAGAVSASILMVVALLGLIAVKGLGHFWPKTVHEYQYIEQAGAAPVRLIGEVHDDEWVPKEQLQQNMPGVTFDGDVVQRLLIKTGNRDSGGLDFRWIIPSHIASQQIPEALIVLERHEWGNFYGMLKEIRENGELIEGGDLWSELQQRLERALFGSNVLVCDFVDAGLQCAPECPPLPRCILTVQLKHSLTRFEWELRVYRYKPSTDSNDGVDSLTRAEAMLKLEMPDREYLPKQFLEPELTESASELRNLEQILHLRNALPHLFQSSCGFRQPDEFGSHIGQ